MKPKFHNDLQVHSRRCLLANEVLQLGALQGGGRGGTASGLWSGSTCLAIEMSPASPFITMCPPLRWPQVWGHTGAGESPETQAWARELPCPAGLPELRAGGLCSVPGLSVRTPFPPQCSASCSLPLNKPCRGALQTPHLLPPAPHPRSTPFAAGGPAPHPLPRQRPRPLPAFPPAAPPLIPFSVGGPAPSDSHSCPAFRRLPVLSLGGTLLLLQEKRGASPQPVGPPDPPPRTPGLKVCLRVNPALGSLPGGGVCRDHGRC